MSRRIVTPENLSPDFIVAANSAAAAANGGAVSLNLSPEHFWREPGTGLIRAVTMGGFFATRAALVAWATGKTPAVGTIAGAAGYAYRYIGSGTAIADLAGWVPFGLTYPDHFAQNLTPGTTDMGPAIAAALAYSEVIYLAPGTYATRQALTFNGKMVCGGGLGANISRIVGLSAFIAIGTPLISMFNRTIVDVLSLGFDTITGTEARYQRVAIRTNDGGSNVLMRGASLKNLHFDQVGTAISDFGLDEFSVHYDTFDIRRHSYAGVDISGVNRTGSVWDNIYINGNDNIALAPVSGFNMENGLGTTVRQLNIEHTSYSNGPLRLVGTSGMQITNLHMEGVDCSVANSGYIIQDGGSVDFGTVAITQTRMGQNNTSIFRLLKAGASSIIAPPIEFATRSVLRIDELSLTGIASPSAFWPLYPAARRGVANCPGFAIFRRDPAYTDSDFSVEVGSRRGGPFNDTYVLDRGFYADAVGDSSGAVVFDRYESRGKLAGGVNLLANGYLDRWLATSGNGTSVGVELPEKWLLISNGGVLNGTQIAGEFGGDSSFAITLNPSPAGVYQAFSIDIPYPSELIGQNCELAFYMKCVVAGDQMSQISATLTNPSGTPTTLFQQIAAAGNTAIQGKTVWTRHVVRFQMFAPGSVTAMNAAASIRLFFNINGATATYGNAFSLRDIALTKLKSANLPRHWMARFSGPLNLDAAAPITIATLQNSTIGLLFDATGVGIVGAKFDLAAADLFVKSLAQDVIAASGPITVANIQKGVIRYDGSAASLTMPLGTALDALPMSNATGLDFSVNNTGTGAATILANTGVVLSGTMVVAANSSGRFRIRKISAGSYSLIAISVGAPPSTVFVETNIATITGPTLSIPDADIFTKQPAPATYAAAQTLSNADIQGKIITYTGAAAALTFPLGTTLDSLFLTNNISLDFSVINTGTGAVTMIANTGVTIVGSAVVPVAAAGVSGSARWTLRRGAAGSYAAYRIG